MQREPLGLNLRGSGWKERTDSPELYSDPHRQTVACVHLHPPNARTHVMLMMTISTEFSAAEVEWKLCFHRPKNNGSWWTVLDLWSGQCSKGTGQAILA